MSLSTTNTVTILLIGFLLGAAIWSARTLWCYAKANRKDPTAIRNARICAVVFVACAISLVLAAIGMLVNHANKVYAALPKVVRYNADGQVVSSKDAERAFNLYSNRLSQTEATIVSTRNNPMLWPRDHMYEIRVSLADGSHATIWSDCPLGTAGRKLPVIGPTNNYGDFLCVRPLIPPLP